MTGFHQMKFRVLRFVCDLVNYTYSMLITCCSIGGNATSATTPQLHSQSTGLLSLVGLLPEVSKDEDLR